MFLIYTASNSDFFFGIYYYPYNTTISGFTDTSIEHFLLINHLLLVYKCYLYKARDSQSFGFLTFKKNIIKVKTLEERTIEERKFFKNCQTINNALSS